MPTTGHGLIVNDVHSRLNATSVADVVQVRDVDELRGAVRSAADRGLRVTVAGGRHAMGGQQFGTDALLIDTTCLTRTHAFDAVCGLIEIEAGAEWPDVIRATHDAQPGEHKG